MALKRTLYLVPRILCSQARTLLNAFDWRSGRRLQRCLDKGARAIGDERDVPKIADHVLNRGSHHRFSRRHILKR